MNNFLRLLGETRDKLDWTVRELRGRKLIRGNERADSICPIEAVLLHLFGKRYYVYGAGAETHAQKLGLWPWQFRSIIMAADATECHDHGLRKRLLEAVGVSE